MTIHLDDGRSFVRRTEKKYDLATYALVDSLVLHSGYSSLRLESFLFTEQAFRDVKEKLDDDGVFVMYNYYRQGWIVGRLYNMAKKVFDAEPIVLGLPYQESIKGTDGGARAQLHDDHRWQKGIEAARAIRRKFAENEFFWVHSRPLWNLKTTGFGPKPPNLEGASTDDDKWQKIGPAAVDPFGSGPIPTDDWPFLYLKDKSIPDLDSRGMALIAVLSLAILLTFTPLRTARPNADVLPRRGVHAPGDEGRRPPRALVRLDLDRQFGRLLRDSRDDLVQQSLRDR